MSENDIKPVAWQYKNGKRWETVSENTYTVYCVGRERRSLYDQAAIDRLTAERDDALAAADSKAGWEWMKRAERAEAERDVTLADAARWNELCRQLDAGAFPSLVVDDAMAMGSGALELHIDAARAKEMQR